jgi:hypothetical protein
MLRLLAAVLLQETSGVLGARHSSWRRRAPGVTVTLAYTGEVISNVHGGIGGDAGFDQLVDGSSTRT